MSSRRTDKPSATFAGTGRGAPLLLGVELVRADVGRSLLGLDLGDAPCGGPITWALFIDGDLVGRTDEAMTDEAAQAWARRMTGEGVRFQRADPRGGYWLADSTDLQGGWSR